MSFRNSKKLRAHIYDIHAEWHLCDMCGVSVKGKGGLRLHMAKHIPSSERRFKCDLCDAAYTRPYLLQKHKTRHAEQKSFECQTCGKKFFDAQDLRIHSSIHAEKDTYKCKQCRQTFSCKRYLAVHVARYHVENWELHCKLCNFKVNTLKDIKDHIQESHEDATQFIGEYFDITSPFCCEICSKYFPNKATHIDHINKFRGTCANRVRVMKNIVACEVCGQIFLSKIKLVHHRKNVHGIIPSKVSDSMDCELCKKKFTSKYLLQSHMNVHRDVSKPFKCQYCIARFATAEFHLDHERIHRGETPFACDVCEKKFPSKKCLWRHYKAHTKPFQCHECGKRFSRKKNWETHQRIHTNERPYGCKYCNRTFKQKTEMEFHQLLHTKEKKFKCGICGFADNKLKVMREHMAINHTEVDDIEDSIVKHDFT
jgi:KRAB domain-containing zinc finger protein